MGTAFPFSNDALGCLLVVSGVIAYCVLKVIELDNRNK